MPIEGGASAARRALLVGVQRGLDPRIAERPGTCAAVRRVAARLGAGGWEVALLLDDEPADEHRPWRSNLLDRLAWLGATSGEALLLLSGPVRDGWFCCRDTRVDRLDGTAVRLEALAAELPPGAGVILDAPADRGAFAGAAWAIGAGPAGGGEKLLGVRGPTPFLDAVVRAMSGEDRAELTVDSLAGFVDRETGPNPWRVGAGPPGALLTDLDRRRRDCRVCAAPVADSAATFCPKCGAPLEVEELLDGGRYRLLRRLGQGGMGQVHLAEDTRLKVRRAIKLLTLPPGLRSAERENLRARMIQEARAAQALCAETHHVVQVYDVGFSPERGEPFLVMELLEGDTLTARLERGRMTLVEAVHVGRQIAATLALAHGRGFVHRDLKPDNIMLVERGGERDFVKLLDFGLVKAEQAEVSTETGRMMGTLQYMPPEQLRGLKVDARADVFSLGAVLYECLTGQRANPGTTQQEIFAVLLDRGVRSLADVAPTMPEPLVRLVDRCLKLIPEQRPPDARAVSDALTAFDPRPLAHLPAMPEVVAPPAHTAVGRAAATALPGRRGEATALGTAETRAPTGADGPPPAVTALPAGPRRVAAPGSPPRENAAPLESAAPLDPRGDRPATVAPTPAVRIDPPGGRPRRWLLLLPALAVAGGVALWLTTPPAEVPPPPAARAAVEPDAAPPADASAPDAAPPDAIADAAATPLARPAHPLPDRPAASRAREGDRLLYRADSPADAFAALVLDVTLAADAPPEPDVKAGERWQAAPEALRVWLADGVPLDGLAVQGDTLAAPAAVVEALRAERPTLHRLRGIGDLLARREGPPVFETVNCGRGRAGDRLLTASWKMRGYGTDACEAAACGPALAHALQTARARGERLRVMLKLGRRSEDGDETADRVSAACIVGP